MADLGETVLTVWSWGWKIFAALVVLLVLIVVIGSRRRERLYKKHFPHATDILTVMSLERWDDMKKIRSLLDAKAGEKIFALREGLAVWYESPSPPSFWDDFHWLEENGFVERRHAMYDRNGNLAPEGTTALVQDEFGLVIGMNREKIREYELRIEYRKTGKGVPRKHRNVTGAQEPLPKGAVPVR